MEVIIVWRENGQFELVGSKKRDEAVGAPFSPLQSIVLNRASIEQKLHNNNSRWCHKLYDSMGRTFCWLKLHWHNVMTSFLSFGMAYLFEN